MAGGNKLEVDQKENFLFQVRKALQKVRGARMFEAFSSGDTRHIDRLRVLSPERRP